MHRILVENGQPTSRLGDKSDRDVRVSAHNSPVLPIKRSRATMRHKSMQRVDMTGQLVTDDEHSSDDGSLPREDYNHPSSAIVQKEEIEWDGIDIDDALRLISRYRKHKGTLQTRITVENNMQFHYSNDSSAEETTSASRGDQMIQQQILETQAHKPTNLKQKSILSVSTTEQTSAPYKPGADDNNRLVADYFRRKIQEFDIVLNSWWSPKSRSDQKKHTDGDSPLSPKEIEAGEESNQQAKQDKKISRLVLAPLQGKNPKRANQTIEADSSSSRIEKEDASTQLSYDLSSRLNDTMSTSSSSGRDIEMGGPLLPEISPIKTVRTYIQTMVFQIPRLRRCLTISGIISIILITYGIGILIGYTSYMRSKK